MQETRAMETPKETEARRNADRLSATCSIPLRITEESLRHIKLSDPRGKLVQGATLLVIDEVTSYIWKQVQCLQLSVNMRVQNSGGDDTAFASYLAQLGNGTFPINQEIGEYKISIPPPHLIYSSRQQDLFEVKHSSVILLRNFDPAIYSLHNHIIEAVVANGTHPGIRIMVPQIPLTTTENYPFSFSRKQFRVKSSFEMISNKSHT
uniref:Uncharacterized protein n=1 Tax=Octopus bimaculoides TaxID=37653 RepID=A0A0L8H686_OCTBM